MKQQELLPQTLDEMVRAAQKRLAEWVARSAGQHKRALKRK
jgi:hypothetical protein